jgi:hypothetical protein
MVTTDKRIVLSDVQWNFLSKRHMFAYGRLTLSHTWAYKSPEELELGEGEVLFQYTFAMDVYSFAVTAYAVCTNLSVLTVYPRCYRLADPLTDF